MREEVLQSANRSEILRAGREPHEERESIASVSDRHLFTSVRGGGSTPGDLGSRGSVRGLRL